MYLKYIFAVVTLLILDFIWIALFMSKKYQILVKNIQNENINPKYIYAIFAYIFMIIGLVLFVIPNINKNSRIKDSFIYGFLFGITVYGIYNMTSAAIFNKWNITLSITDILWGGCVYFIAALVSSLIKN